MPITERTTRLKANTVSKACHAGSYLGDVVVSLERARLWTESYRASEGQPEIVRRALALEHMLKHMAIYIQPEELIVGNNTESPRHLYLSPEISYTSVKEAVDENHIAPADLKLAQEIMDYWRGRGLCDRVEAEFSPEERRVLDSTAVVTSLTYKDGAQHCVPNWEYVYSEGLVAIRQRLAVEIAALDRKVQSHVGPGTREILKERHLFRAMALTVDAVLMWTERYAVLAEQQAAKEANPQRKAELESIGQVCRRTLRLPPESFQEAVQGFFFLHLILHYIDRAGFGSLARVDQMWWPSFKKDVLEDKRLPRAHAQEILECLFVKMLDLGYWFPRNRRLHFEGNSLLQTLTLGGVDGEGADACNELTLCVLDAVRSIRTNQPTFNFRYHPQVAEAALDRAIDVAKTGLGMPAFLNDRVMIDSLLDQGVPLREARNWAVVGCVSACPVNMQITTKRLAQSCIIAKCFEFALTDGECMLSKQVLGLRTGAVAAFSFEDLIEAFRRQVEFAFQFGVRVRNITRAYEMECLQRPLATALHRSPLTVRKDVSEYEDAPNLWINCVGMVDVVDSLQAVRQLVFAEKRLSLGELIAILRHNWEGQEALRQTCLNKVPKFGNAHEEVDGLAARVFKLVSDEARRAKDINGGTYRILPQSVSMYVSSGKKTGALPNGRKHGDFLSDGGISPSHGLDHNGPTAVLLSAARVDHGQTKGILLNQRFHPDALEGDAGRQRFKAYLKTWYDLGLSQIQFNVVSTQTLREAQEHPERFGDVIVRVAGYSAYFTELGKAVQDAIISRMEQRLS
jgi:benzylsuccinate synthase